VVILVVYALPIDITFIPFLEVCGFNGTSCLLGLLAVLSRNLSLQRVLIVLFRGLKHGL
jgi:hypothetical protein